MPFKHESPPVQAFPHVPQLLMSVRVLVQLPAQLMYGAGPHTHELPEHVIPVAQVVCVCHVPVLLHSCIVFPLHCTEPGAHPTHPPLKHTGVGAAQAVQLAPQWAGSEFVSYAHEVEPPHAL